MAGCTNVWAIGDCALVGNGMTGPFAPPTAQFAVAQAQALARNIAASIEGRATQPFAHESKA